ncbi:MAG: HD domain-containing phosphohydrolase [Candidatus Aminicenantaceae bacterium]
MSADKILLVEDDEKKRRYLARFLTNHSLDTVTSPSTSEAFNQLLKQNIFSLVLIGFPSFNNYNIKILQHIKKIDPQLSTIVLSKLENPEIAVSLIKQGLIDHIAYPDNLAEIYSAIRNEFNKRDLIRKNVSYLQSLRKLSSESSSNIKRALELENIYNTTLENLMTALDLRDVETFGHSRTVAKYSEVLAKILGIKKKEALDNIRKGALLHDVGKIAIPDSILKKPTPLTDAEWKKIKLHPSLGYGLIKEIKLLKEAANIILYHHERVDGKGYPKGLKKDHIPIESRIFSLADALDAITSHRPYRKERDFPAAKEEIQINKGKQFDSDVVDAFCSLSLEKWEKFRYETTKLLPPFEELQEIRKELNERAQAQTSNARKSRL